MSFSKRQGNDAVCYTKPLDSLKSWNDHFFWVDAFACPASFPWNTSKSVSNDPFPKSSEFNAEHYATLVAYPASFHKYPEPFLCLVGISQMDLLSFIQTVDPTKVRVGERQRAEDEPRLLDTTVGRVVLLLPITPARAEIKLDASVDKLFDEGGNGNQAEQGDSASGGHDVGIQLVSEVAETVVEDVAHVQLRRQRKRKTIVFYAGGPFHPPKKLRGDHGTLSKASIGGKSRFAVQRLLAGAVQNTEVRGEPIPTLPFVTSSISATPEHEDEAHTASATGLNLRTIGAPPRPYIPLMTMATTVTSTVDPATTVKEKKIESSIFGGDSSGGGVNHTASGFSDLTGSDFIVTGIRTVISPDTDLQKVYVPQWSVTNGSRLDDGHTCREMVDEFAPPKFFALIRGMEHDQLFTEFNVGAARQMSLSAKVRMRAEYNIRERRRLNSVVEEKNSLLKARDEEVKRLKAQLLVKEAEAAEAIHLRAEASKFEVVEESLRDEVKVLKEQNATLEQEKTDLSVKVAILLLQLRLGSKKLLTWMLRLPLPSLREVNEKFDKLCANFVEMALYLEEKFYSRLLTTIFGRRWLLTYGMQLAIAKCLNSTEYLSTLGAAIGKAVEKGMQEGLSARITRGADSRKLTDVAAYNPSAKADYLSALQRLQSVNFSLIAELRANKDASIDIIMNLLCLEDTLAERLGLTESQPHVNQLMVPIHHSPDQRVIGASALLLSLDVSSSRVRKIKENISNHVSALRGVFVPLSEPLSAVALEGTEGTSGGALGTADTTTAVSIVVASTSIVRPISIDDYEVTGVNDQATEDGNVADKDANPFPNVDDAELNVSE
ncbi:hypothetical protein Tco_1371403 [Tanacetum coccineum]